MISLNRLAASVNAHPDDTCSYCFSVMVSRLLNRPVISICQPSTKSGFTQDGVVGVDYPC